MAAAQVLGLGEYYGSSIRRRQAYGFAITENLFAPDHEIPVHEHTYGHFTVILDGGFRESYDEVTLDCAKGSILIVPANRRHRDQVGAEGAHTLSVELSPKRTQVLTQPQVLTTPEAQRKGQMLYAEFRKSDPASLLAVEAIALEILVMVARTKPEDDTTWMEKVMREIHRDVAANIPLGNLAAIAGVHESHLARAFRQVHGCTVGEYVRWLRLEDSKRRLRHDGQSVAEIAAELGFYDQAHFSRLFRTSYGMSPSAYRKMYAAR